MAKELWEIPVPPTALFDGPKFTVLSKRRCELSFRADSEGSIISTKIIFESVEAFKCTYRSALTAEIVKAAYGRIVDMGRSEWFVEVSKQSIDYYTMAKRTVPALRHLAICFDDGPCFELICTSFEVST